MGCYLAYALPVICKLSTGSRYWLAGPFSLGPRLSYINNIVTLAWVLTVTVVFTLPQFYPITLRNMNWSAPILGAVLAFSLGWYYFPKYGAKSWFLGPRANLGQFNDVLPSDKARKAGAGASKAAVHPTVVATDTAVAASSSGGGKAAAAARDGGDGGGDGGGSSHEDLDHCAGHQHISGDHHHVGSDDWEPFYGPDGRSTPKRPAVLQQVPDDIIMLGPAAEVGDGGTPSAAAAAASTRSAPFPATSSTSGGIRRIAPPTRTRGLRPWTPAEEVLVATDAEGEDVRVARDVGLIPAPEVQPAWYLAVQQRQQQQEEEEEEQEYLRHTPGQGASFHTKANPDEITHTSDRSTPGSSWPRTTTPAGSKPAPYHERWSAGAAAARRRASVLLSHARLSVSSKGLDQELYLRTSLPKDEARGGAAQSLPLVTLPISGSRGTNGLAKRRSTTSAGTTSRRGSILLYDGPVQPRTVMQQLLYGGTESDSDGDDLVVGGGYGMPTYGTAVGAVGGGGGLSERSTPRRPRAERVRQQQHHQQQRQHGEGQQQDQQQQRPGRRPSLLARLVPAFLSGADPQPFAHRSNKAAGVVLLPAASGGAKQQSQASRFSASAAARAAQRALPASACGDGGGGGGGAWMLSSYDDLHSGGARSRVRAHSRAALGIFARPHASTCSGVATTTAAAAAAAAVNLGGSRGDGGEHPARSLPRASVHRASASVDSGSIAASSAQPPGVLSTGGMPAEYSAVGTSPRMEEEAGSGSGLTAAAAAATRRSHTSTTRGTSEGQLVDL